MTNDFWYRYEDSLISAGVDECDNPLGPPRVHVYLYEYPVIKYTPKGAWISVGVEKKFVLRDARKRFACPTVEEARESFIARKRAYVRHLNARMVRAQEAIRFVETTERQNATRSVLSVLFR